MLYKYIIPSDIQAEIDKQNYGREVLEKLDLYLSSESSIRDRTNDYDPLIANVWISKPDKNGGPRYIWFENRKNEACVYALRKIFKHDEYVRKIKDSTKHRWVASHPFSESDKKEISFQLEEMLNPEKRKPLPDEYKVFENRDKKNWPKHRDELVFESNEWRENIKNLSYDEKRAIYHRLNEIIKCDFTGLEQNEKIFSDKINDYVIYLRISSVLDGLRTRLDSIFLLNIIPITEVSQKTLESLYSSNYNTDDCEVLKKRFHKSYSIYLFGEDEKKWLEVEEQDCSNLTLSQNEYETLKEIEYPFFLSGLSGSGKSTILQYLFACAYHYQAKNYPDHKLLFLSYSKKLTENAFELVYHLLRNPSNYFHVEAINDTKEREKLKNCFQSFTEFLIDIFLDEDEKKVFSKDNYINFERFKYLYKQECNLPEKESYSAALVWSIIRTYIKGENDAEDFTPYDFRQLCLRRKSKNTPLMDITIDDYEHIYRIYREFYKKYHETKKKSDTKLWDDMDLIRTVLQKEKSYDYFHQYAVVVCDEMQDFTKMELKLIFKLTAHSQYSAADNNGLKISIPIALAGDPNQTINPTGFSFSAIYNIFDEVFKENFTHINHIKPYFLKDNYRSKERIVQFANVIHYLRNRLFDRKNKVSAQTAWNADDPSKQKEEYLSFIRIDENYEKIKYALCKSNIITADDGEYALNKNGEADEYTEKRKKELEIPENQSEYSIDHRLYTALSSKGLEFSTSVLFKFSSDEATDLFVKKINGISISTSEDIILSHFFTKLYISLSRARNGLFIVDTDEGYEKFWKYFIEDQYWMELKRITDDNLDTLRTNSCMPIGMPSDFVRIIDNNYRPEEDAKALFEVGKKNEDSEKMRRAAKYYHDAGTQYLIDENKSRAYAYLYDADYEQAGISFKEIGEMKEAFDAFWKGRSWSLAAICSVSGDDEILLKQKVASFMCNRIDIETFLNDCLEMKYQWSRLSKGDKKAEDTVLNSIINKMDEDLRGIPSSGSHYRINNSLDSFFCDDGILSEIRAKLYYYDGEESRTNYKKAVVLWESSGYIPKSLEYYHAKYISAPSESNKIRYLNVLGKKEEIFAQYGMKNDNAELDNDVKKIVFDILISKNFFENALIYPYCDYKYKYGKLYELDKLKYLAIFLREVGSGIDNKYFKESSDIAFGIIKKRFVNDYDEIIAFLNTNKDYLLYLFKSRYWKEFMELKINNGKTLRTKLKPQNLLSAVRGGKRYCKDNRQSLFILNYVLSSTDMQSLLHEFSPMIIDAISHSIPELINNSLSIKILHLLEGILRDAVDGSPIDIHYLIDIYRRVYAKTYSEKEYSFMDVTERIVSFLNPIKNKSVIYKLKSLNVYYTFSGRLSIDECVFLKLLHEYDLPLKELAFHLPLSQTEVLIRLLEKSETKMRYMVEIIANKKNFTMEIEELMSSAMPVSENVKRQKDYSELIAFYDYCIANKQLFHHESMLKEIELKKWLVIKLSSDSLISVSEAKEFLFTQKTSIINLKKHLNLSDFLTFIIKLDKLDQMDDCLLELCKSSLGKYHIFDNLFAHEQSYREHLKEMIINKMAYEIKHNEINILTHELASYLIMAVKNIFPNKMAKEIYATFLNIMVDSEHNSINSELWKKVSTAKKILNK